MTLSLRSKLTFAFALVAAVPLAMLQQGASRLVRRDFAERTRGQLAGSRRLIEKTLAREAADLGSALAAVERDLDVRGELIAYHGGDSRAQAKLIAALQRAHERYGLPLLSVYSDAAMIVASAQEPERFDVRDETTLVSTCTARGGAVLGRETGIDVRGLALRRCLRIGDGYHLIGGRRLDDDFLAQLPVTPELAFLVVGDEPGVRFAPTAASRAAEVALDDVGRSPPAVAAGLDAAGWDVEPVVFGGDAAAPEGVGLMVAVSRAPMQAALDRQAWIFGALLVGGLAIAWFLAAVMSRHWSSPIERLVAALERVGRGDLDARVDLDRSDELGRLGQAFDRMTGELATSRARLVQAERVAAWQEIARRLAHEIKNPLSPIALSMETLRRSHAAGREDFPELLEECTSTVLEEVDRLRRIVQEFTDFARLPKPRRVVGSFHQAIRRVLALHAGMGKRFVLESDLRADDDRFAFDPDQMNRLLVNLIQNAFEAMPDGGTVRVVTGREAAAERFLLTIADDGPGVPADVAGELFQPYHTSKPGGTGLGLAIVSRIVSEHRGSVRLCNPGEPGAVFEVELPMGDGAAAPRTVGAGLIPARPNADDGAGAVDPRPRGRRGPSGRD